MTFEESCRLLSSPFPSSSGECRVTVAFQSPVQPMNSLDSRVEKSLRDAHDALALRGELLSAERLQACYAAFRSRFGPDVLKSLDGPALLNAMHTHGNKESLVYWLEFKNDDEFPGPTFGSIAGGSAHKFGLFRRKETNQWVVGSLPIRLTQTPTTCRVLPLSRVKFAEGRCPDVARDTKERAEGVERVEPPVEAECELVEVGL